MTSPQQLRVLIAGGGSGGHVIPALAIARQLRDAYGAQVRLVGTARGMETRLVPQAGFPLDLVEAGQLNQVSLLIRLRTVARLPLGLVTCLRLISSFRPHVILGVGGYASGPMMAAALLRRIPTLVYEPNAIPGMVNRLVGRRVSMAAINFIQSQPYFKRSEVTGIPVRPEFFQLPPAPQPPPINLLVFGGSQGARILNQRMAAILPQLLAAVPGLHVLHQAGGRLAEATQQAFAATGADPARWQVHAFLDDMPTRFGQAHLILARAGATTVAEIAAAAKPSLLVPFAAAADDHQRKNAEAMASAGASRLLIESECTSDALLAQLTALLSCPEDLRSMGQHARSLARPDAVHRIAQLAVELANR